MNFKERPGLKKSSEPVSLSEILSPVRKDLRQVEVYLSRWADSASPAIRKMARAAFQKPGKLIRPGILLLAASQLGYRGKKRIAAAAAVEAIHTASLIHDDIIDGSATRRGEKTMAAAYGEKFSLLLGDFFFIRSIAASVRAISPKITDYLTRVTEKMIEGEAEELAQAFNFNLEEKTYWYIVESKTASLFEATCLVAAELAGARPKDKKALSAYGKNLGLAFQVVDDLIDITGSPEETGKPAFSDLREGRMTLPFILAREAASTRDKNKLRQLVEKSRNNHGHLKELFVLLNQTGALQQAYDQAEKLVKKSKESINYLPPTPYSLSLLKMADFVLRRKY